MNKFLLAAFACFALVWTAAAQLAFNQSVTNGTTIAGVPATTASNNGAWFLVGNATMPQTVYSLNHGLLITVQGVTNYIELSVGDTNAPVIVAIVSPSVTNADSVDSFTLQRTNLPVYSRVVVAGTNTTRVAAQIVTGVNGLVQ
jgi:hypothetical protein